MTTKVHKTVQGIQKQVHNVSSRTYTIAGVLAFAAIGTILLVGSHAATPTANFEAEAGTRSGNVATVTDATASGGSAVKFGTAPTGSCTTPGRLTITTANNSTYPAYPVGAKVYVPGGSDPWGGCFPSAVTTGYPHGAAGDTRTPVTLTDYTGPCTITTPNVVIDKKNVNCDLDVQAQGLVVTNSNITGQIYVNSDFCGDNTKGSFTVSDTTIHTTWYLTRALMYCNYTATRVDASGGGSMATCRFCTIQDSYFHDPLEDPTGHAHNSTVRLGEYANLLHNTLWCQVKSYNATDGSGESSGCSADQTAYSHDGIPPFVTTSKHNFYQAGNSGYCGWGGTTGPPGDTLVHDVKFIENIYQRGSMPAWNWSPTSYICAGYGPMTGLDLSRPGNAWTGNTWDNGKPLGLEQNTWATNPSLSNQGPCDGAPSNCTW